jgi:hypothetical protein
MLNIILLVLAGAALIAYLMRRKSRLRADED